MGYALIICTILIILCKCKHCKVLQVFFNISTWRHHIVVLERMWCGLSVKKVTWYLHYWEALTLAYVFSFPSVLIVYSLTCLPHTRASSDFEIKEFLFFSLYYRLDLSVRKISCNFIIVSLFGGKALSLCCLKSIM
jgi:hypothetical protein